MVTTSEPTSPGCVFCGIASGEAEASIVYEDAEAVAFLSLDQPTSHKVLIIPRSHKETIFDLPPDDASHLFRVASDIARAIRDASGCTGLNVIQSNGACAGQDVPHFHMHLIPRHEGDGVTLEWPHIQPERAELDQMAAEIRAEVEERR